MKAIYEKKMNEVFALQNDLSIDDMNQVAKEVYEELDPKLFVDDDARWARAYRRARGAFQKKSKTMSKAVDGMIVCRMPDFDFNRRQYDFAMSRLTEKGLEVAISEGLVNSDGNPIYQWGDQRGKPILNDNKEIGRPGATGRAIGYTFEKNDDGEYKYIEPRYFIINKDKSENKIPVCQVGKLTMSVLDDKQERFFADTNKAFYNDASISNQHKSPYSYEEVQEILGQWNMAFGDHFVVVSNANDLEKYKAEYAFSKEHKENEFKFCVVPGIVCGVQANERYANGSITLEFIDYDTFETSLITISIPQPMIQGLDIADDDQGIFVLQVSSYLGKDGVEKYRWHLGGFLHVDDGVNVEEFFGVDLEDENV